MRIFKLSVNVMLVCTFCAVSAQAQEVVATSGDFFTNPNGSISWTLGEPISESFAVNQQILSQGFQQSAQNYAAISIVSNTNLIAFFPNPFDEIIHLQNQTEEKELMLALYDEKMALIKKTTIHSGFNNESTISFQDLEAGVYFLHIQSQNGKVESMQKLIKKTL
jgi:hypothetical protein